MSSNVAKERVLTSELNQVHSSVHEKGSLTDEQQLEHVDSSNVNFQYNNDEEEPEIHARTYIALVAMFLLNLVQVVALQGPPAVVRLDCYTTLIDQFN